MEDAYFKEIHDVILDKLESIETQTKKTNGRVTEIEKELISAKNDIAQALKIISGHSTIITAYKQERDKTREDLIEEQRRKINSMEERDKKFNQRLLYTSIVAIVFIASMIGLVNPDLVKVILGTI